MQTSNFSRAIKNGVGRHATGVSGGLEDQSVATAPGGNANDIGSFLGPLPPFSGRQKASDKFSRETWDMPDRYADEVQFLTNVLDFFIIDQAEFWTTRILPWAQTDQIHFKWNIWKFDRTIADIEPHQGVPRLVTSSRESRSSSLVRRGLAFMIEHGFYNTDQGRETFALNLRQITDAVHTTCYSDCLHSLLQANQYYREWHTKFGQQGGRQEDIMQRERRRWSIVSKSPRGMYLLDADLKAEMRREGVVPDTWVWPARMSTYLHMVPEEEVDYSKRGAGAYEALASGKEWSSFRGLPCFTAFPLDTDFNGAPISLLERHRMCGEWFVLPAGEEAIHIFSADADRFIKLDKNTIRAKAINKNANGSFTTGAPGNTTDTAADQVDLLVFRPFQTWNMCSAILCKAGNELGSTFHGHHDMQLQNDAVRKIMVGHYTFYSRAIVKNPKLLSVVEDVFCQDYVAGEGHEFFDDAAEFEKHWGQQDIGTKRCRKSLIAWAVPKGTAKSLPDSIDIMGDFPSAQSNVLAEGTRSFDGVQRLEASLMLGALRPLRQSEGNLFLRAATPLNTVMFRGMQYTQGPTVDGEPEASKPRITQLGTGHWGKNIYAGCAAHRTGLAGDGFLKEQNYRQDLE